MPTTFTLHEPSPHISASKTPFGRGGAGNRTSQSTSTTSNDAIPNNTRVTPATLTQPPFSINTHLAHSHSLSQYKPFSTGRGGAGNHRPADDERRLFSFDEELDHQLATAFPRASSNGTGASRRKPGNNVPVYHIGRGGSGNAVASMQDAVVAAGGGGGGGVGFDGRRGSDSEGSEGSGSRKGVSSWVKGLTGRRI